MRKMIRKLVAPVVGAIIVITTMLVMATGASATAFTWDVYAPERNGSTITGWAKLSRDCANTFGCWNYMKIERQRLWGIEYVGGNWVSHNGWNSITVELPAGCHDYRTTVDSYNDALSNQAISGSYKAIGVSVSGETIVEFHKERSSGFTRICR